MRGDVILGFSRTCCIWMKSKKNPRVDHDNGSFRPFVFLSKNLVGIAYAHTRNMCECVRSCKILCYSDKQIFIPKLEKDRCSFLFFRASALSLNVLGIILILKYTRRSKLGRQMRDRISNHQKLRREEVF